MRRQASGTQLLSVLQHLAASHSDECSIEERKKVVQAALSVGVSGASVQNLIGDLIHYCRISRFPQGQVKFLTLHVHLQRRGHVHLDLGRHPFPTYSKHGLDCAALCHNARLPCADW